MIKKLTEEQKEIKKDIKLAKINLGFHQAELEKYINEIDVLEKYLDELEDD